MADPGIVFFETCKQAISTIPSIPRSWTGEPGPYEPEVVELIQAALELSERIGDPELRLSKALRALKHHQREAADIP